MKVLNFKLFLLVLIIISMVGCTNKNWQQSDTNQSIDKEKIIVTSFYPMYIMTKNITKDIPDVKVVSMTQNTTGCLHDYEITPDQLQTLQKASMFVVNGAGMEAFMEKVIKQYPNIKIVEASKGLELLKNSADGEYNPHIWVGVSGAINEVNNIAQQLSLYDPQNADKYLANMNEYVAKLEALKQKMDNDLSEIENRNIITFHEAFPYFEKEFNLNIVGVIEREPGSEPSAGELKETIQKINTLNVKALFVEPQYSPKAAATIARETGAKVYTLDPGVTGEDDLNAYINIMESNLIVLKEALK